MTWKGAAVQEKLARKKAAMAIPQQTESQEDKAEAISLVSEAQDPNNLCRLFHGWAPWL